METQFLRLLVDQFGKFQKISSWFDPENPLMDVRNDSERVTHINVQSIYFHLSPRKTSINPLNLAQMQKPMAVSESAGPDGSEAPLTF